MSNLKTKLGRLYVAEETTFGTDPSASGAAYLYLHALDRQLMKFSNEVLASNFQNEILADSADEIGAQKASISFKLPLRASGVPSVSPGTPAVLAEVDLILKAALGTVTRGQASAIAGGNASASNILVGASGGFVKGGLVWCAVRNEMRPVSAIPDGTHVTVAPAFGGIPTSGDLIPGSVYTPATTGHKSLAMVSFIDSIQVCFLGGKVSALKFGGLAANERPFLEVTLDFDSYTISAKGSLPAADDRFPAVKAPFTKGAPFWLSGAQQLVAGAELDLGIETAFSPATEGLQGRGGFEVTMYKPKGKIEPYYAAGFLTDFAAGTLKTLALGVGNQSTGWGFYISSGQYLDHEIADKAGQVVNAMPFGAKDPATTGDPLIAVTVF